MIRIILFFIASLAFLPQKEHHSGLNAIKGNASYYGIAFHGKKTANGEIYNRYLYTAAHRNLPFNTLLRITNLKNQLSISVRINDRGPYNYSRIIDLSEAAARRIGSYQHGLTTVLIEKLDLIQHTPELDELFTNCDVVDCLGNEDHLSEYSIQLYQSTDLLHIIYIANELYLHDDVDKVLIVGKGTGINRTYSIVISDFPSKTECRAGKDYFERKGFMQVVMLNRS